MNNSQLIIKKLQEGADLLPNAFVEEIIREVELETQFIIPMQLRRAVSFFCMTHISQAMPDSQMTREMKLFALAIIIGYEEARRG